MTPEQEKQLLAYIQELRNRGYTREEVVSMAKTYAEELKKKVETEELSQESTEPQEQPTKPSATTGGLDYTRQQPKSAFQGLLAGTPLAGVIGDSAPSRSQTKEKPKQPPMDVTYTPEAMPSETTQSVVPKSTQEKIKTFDVAEKEIEQGQLPSNPELRTPETVERVEKRREQLGMNTLEEGAAEAIQKHKDREFNENFADVEDIVDDYIRYSDNKSAMFGAPDYDFGSGKGKWSGLPGLGGRLQESKEGGTDIERQGKRGEILNTVMNDYFSYLQKTNPSQAEAFRNKYSAIKSSTDRDANDEKFLQGLEGHALKLRAAAIKKNMDVYKTAIEQYSQIEKRVNFQGYDKDVKDLKQSAKNLNQELKNGNISEEEYAARWAQLQKGFEDARIKNGLTDDVTRQLDGAKQVYFAYGQEAMKMSSLFGFMDQNSKEYREYNQLQKDIEEAQKAREAAWNTASWYEKPHMALAEKARSFAGGVGNLVLDILQAPKVLEDLVTGDTNHNFLDEYYDGIENYQLEKQKHFGETDSESTIQYLSSLGGNAIASIVTFALGGSFGGASKLAQFGSTFTTAFLSAEAGAYEEAISTYRMSPRQAASAATAVATATALVESLIPDIKYFEASPFRKSVMRYIAEGKGITAAAREALPASANSYLKTGIKEGGEELLGQSSEDITKEVINFVGQTEYFKELWKSKNYVDSFLGGFIGGTTMNVFKRPQGSSPIMEGVMLDAAENADAIISQNTNERIHSQLKTNLSEAKKDLESLRVHPNWSSLDRTKKGHVFGITQQIKALESSDVKDPIINAQIEKLKSEREELLSLGSNGVDSRTVGTSTSPQRVMIGGTQNAEQSREIEVLNQKKSQFVGPRAAQLMNENKITRKDAQALAEEEWSKTEDGKKREQLISQTQGEQANFFINEDGDYEIEYNNGKSVVIPKGEGAAEKIRSMGIKSDTGEVSGVTKENTNTLITPRLEKGATIDYNGKNATINSYKEKDGKVVYVNATTEDGRTLQIREGQPGAGQELLNNLNSLPYDQKDQTRVSGEVGKGQEPIQTQPIETTSSEAPATSGVLQAQEEVNALKDVESTTKALENMHTDREKLSVLKHVSGTLRQNLVDIAYLLEEEESAENAPIYNKINKIGNSITDDMETMEEGGFLGNFDEVYQRFEGRLNEAKELVESLTPRGEFKQVLSLFERVSKKGVSDWIKENSEQKSNKYHKAKAKPESEQTTRDKELIKEVESLLSKEQAPETKPTQPTSESQVTGAENLTSTVTAPSVTVETGETAKPKTRAEKLRERKKPTAQAETETKTPPSATAETGGTTIKVSEAAPAPRRVGSVEASKESNPDAGEDSALEGAGMTKQELGEWKNNNRKKQPKENKVLDQARQLVNDLFNGAIPFKTYLEKIKKVMPSKLMDKIPTPATFKEIIGSIDSNKLKIGIVGLNKFIKKGTRVGLRIDIPAFNRFGKNVVTIHDRSKARPEVVGYGSVGSISNVKFTTRVGTALNIGLGEKSKEAFAMAEGDWMDESEESILKRAEEALNSPEWVQVSMNPAKHSFFYDKADGNPVTSADEVIQVGNLVLAKNPKKIDISTEAGMKEFQKSFTTQGAKGPIQYRVSPARQETTESMRDVMAAINSTKEALAQAGIDVVPMSNEEFMSNPDVIADGGGENTEGIFFAEDGKILLNLDMLKNKWGKTIVFHEGTHPIINIIRNTDPKRYKAIVEGMRREAQKNPKAFQSATNHAEQYRAEGEERVEDEFVTEVIAQIASGKLKLSNFTPSLRDQIISMINDILRALGLPQINLKSPEAAVRAAAEQITELLNKGGKLSEVVGSKNVGKFQSVIGDGQRSIDARIADKGVQVPRSEKLPLKIVASKEEDVMRRINELLDKYPNALTDKEQWKELMSRVFPITVDGEVFIPAFPEGLARMAGSVQETLKEINKVSDEQRKLASEGLKGTKEIGELYRQGKMDEVDTGLYFLWNIMSIGISPYPQESGFLQAVNGGVDKYIKLAAAGEFNENTLKEYLNWVDEALPKGTPGAGSKSNLNSFGKSFLSKAAQKIENGEFEGKTKLQALHEILSDRKTPTDKLRRKWQANMSAMQFNNKIFDFILLTTGRSDLFVTDRVRVDHFWGGNNFKKKRGLKESTSLYDGSDLTYGAAAGAGFSKMLSDVPGLVFNELANRTMTPIVEKAYKQIGVKDYPEVGRFHWETWVAASSQEVSHGSIDAIVQRKEKGEIQDAGIRQGKYGAWDFNFSYRKRTGKDFVYEFVDNEGNTYVFDKINDIQDEIEKQKKKTYETNNRFLLPDAKGNISRPTKGLSTAWYDAKDESGNKLVDSEKYFEFLRSKAKEVIPAPDVVEDQGVIIENSKVSEESKKGQKKGQRAIQGGRDIAETLDEFAPNVEETVDRIKSATKEDGATLNLDGTVYDNGGLVVPASSINVAQKDMSAEGLFDFMKSNEENISSDIFKIGLYRFPDRAEVSYDLNIVIPREHRAVALEFGRLAGQESLFDLDTYENVKTGADGKNPRSFTAEELAEIAQELSEGKLPRVVGGQRSVKSGRDVPSLVDDAGLTKNMTEDEDGNYIFYHKTNKPLSKIDPKFFGKTLATSRDERPGVDISMYYTRKDAGESMVGGNYSYIVRVPKDKVYPINADPLNLYDKAKKEFQKDFPGQTFDPNKQIGYITKEAQKLGYDMTVAKWQKGPLTLRAQTTKALKPEVYYSPSREFPSAIVINEEIDTLKPNEKKMRRKGARSLEGGRELSQEDAYNAILDKIDELEATNMSPEEQFNEISQSEEYASLSPEDRMAVNDSYRESGVSTADKKIESVVTNDIKEQNAVLQSLKDDRDLAYIYRNFPQIIKQLQSKNIIETKGDCI